MSATTWFIIAIVGFSLSGIALVAAVFIFIKLNIPTVIGDLSGKTVAREIKAIRDANVSSGDKLHNSSSVNANRGKLTEKVIDDEIDSSAGAVAHASKRLDRIETGHSTKLRNDETGGQGSGRLSKGRTTESLSANVEEVDIEQRRSTAVLSQNHVINILVEDRKTNVLNEHLGTAVLSETRKTEVLSSTNGTEVLNDNDSNGAHGGTTVLDEANDSNHNVTQPVTFKVTKSVVKIHTDEVI